MAAVGGFLAVTHTFNTAQTTTETIPPGATQAVIEVWSGSDPGGAVGASSGGGGGAGGAFCKTTVSVIGAGSETLNLVIGA